MTFFDKLNLVGLLLNFIGGLLLTVALSKLITGFHGSIAIHDQQIIRLNHIAEHRSGEIMRADIGPLLRPGARRNRLLSNIGMVLLVIGFFLQLLPISLKVIQG